MGFVVPNFDNAHYFFLLNTCNLTVPEYDMLSIVPYVGLIVGTFLYLNVLRKIEVWKLILASLLLQMVITGLQITNVLRLNLKIGFNDFYYNLIIMALNKASMECLCVLPMTILLTYISPRNIEASMFSLVTACLYFSSDWGSNLIGGMLCHFYGVNSKDDGTRYS